MPSLLEAVEVLAAVLADGRHDQRLAAQHLQVVGDVGRAAAVFGAQGRHQERDVHLVQLVGQQGLAEKRPLYCMILSKASDPQIRVVLVMVGLMGRKRRYGSRMP
jgi:hypothetical protein